MRTPPKVRCQHAAVGHVFVLADRDYDNRLEWCPGCGAYRVGRFDPRLPANDWRAWVEPGP